MKRLVTSILSLLIPIAALGEDQQTPTISSNCKIRSRPVGKDGSTVEYSWTITAKTSEDRVLSFVQFTRMPGERSPAMIRGQQKFLYCKAGSTHEKEITLEVDQALDDGNRTYWFEGFLTGLINEDVVLPESATVSVTTRQVRGTDDPGHLIGVNVSENGGEIYRHYIFISFWSPAELQSVLPAELSAEERELRDGNVWQIFTDPKGWESGFRRCLEFDK